MINTKTIYVAELEKLADDEPPRLRGTEYPITSFSLIDEVIFVFSEKYDPDKRRKIIANSVRKDANAYLLLSRESNGTGKTHERIRFYNIDRKLISNARAANSEYITRINPV